MTVEEGEWEGEGEGEGEGVTSAALCEASSSNFRMVCEAAACKQHTRCYTQHNTRALRCSTT